MSGLTDSLDSMAEKIRLSLAVKDAAREKTLPLCREIIRRCSQAIRAVHRQEFDRAQELLGVARSLLDEVRRVVAECPELEYSGSVKDAQKEFAEGSIVLALIIGKQLPEPDEIGIDSVAYLNGWGEAVGELRRYLLDSLRRGDLAQGEEFLAAMDDIYSVLVTMDFPEATTSGLRRTTDLVRGVLERTRTDLTLVMRQRELENGLEKLERNLG